MSASLFSLYTFAIAAAIAASPPPVALPPATGSAPQPHTTVSASFVPFVPFESITTQISNAVARTFANFVPPPPNPMDYPVRVVVPSIGLDAPIQNMGLNDKGEMDVPDGATDNVGWYAGGTVPGYRGSAVFDAHVYAAFKDLRHAKVGSDIYVITAGGKTLHFVINDSRVYKLSELSPRTLFAQNDAKRLNLITCAGEFDATRNTYEKRLVAYASLIEE